MLVGRVSARTGRSAYGLPLLAGEGAKLDPAAFDVIRGGGFTLALLPRSVGFGGPSVLATVR